MVKIVYLSHCKHASFLSKGPFTPSVSIDSRIDTNIGT